MEGEKIALPVSVLVLRADVEPLVCSGGGGERSSRCRTCRPAMPSAPAACGSGSRSGGWTRSITSAGSGFSSCLQPLRPAPASWQSGFQGSAPPPLLSPAPAAGTLWKFRPKLLCCCGGKWGCDPTGQSHPSRDAPLSQLPGFFCNEFTRRFSPGHGCCWPPRYGSHREHEQSCPWCGDRSRLRGGPVSAGPVLCRWGLPQLSPSRRLPTPQTTEMGLFSPTFCFLTALPSLSVPIPGVIPGCAPPEAGRHRVPAGLLLWMSGVGFSLLPPMVFPIFPFTFAERCSLWPCH